MPISDCPRLFIGTLSCALRRADEDGIQEPPAPHTLLEQPDAADTIPTGLAIDPTNGDVYFAGPTDFAPDLRLVIEKFDYDLTGSQGVWLDLTTVHGITVPAGVPPTVILETPMVITRDGLYLYLLSIDSTPTTIAKLRKFNKVTTALINTWDVPINGTAVLRQGLVMTISNAPDAILMYMFDAAGSDRGVIGRFNTVTDTFMSDIRVENLPSGVEDIKVLPNGELLVSAFGPHNVQRFTASGTFIQEYTDFVGTGITKRRVSVGPDNTFWSHYGSRPPGAGAFVVSINVTSGVATQQGELDTPYPDDKYTQLETFFCIPPVPPSGHRWYSTTLVGAT